MHPQTQEWLNERLSHLRTLADEIRLDLHLAGMEAKSRWTELEANLRELERGVQGGNTRERADALLAKFRQLHERVKSGDKKV